ncbi:hypothetical protein G6F68_021023 [Rhizopus microsporus]|nr:hypothetical protein G6F68_021023 [Rhizopus microsporus]
MSQLVQRARQEVLHLAHALQAVVRHVFHHVQHRLHALGFERTAQRLQAFGARLAGVVGARHEELAAFAMGDFPGFQVGLAHDHVDRHLLERLDVDALAEACLGVAHTNPPVLARVQQRD